MWSGLVIIAVTTILSILGLLVVSPHVAAEILRDYNDVVGSYIGAFATLYAIILGFAIFLVWSQFNDARSTVVQESNELANLSRIAQGFPDPVRTKIAGLIQNYAQAVATDEWKRMRKGESSKQAQDCLSEIWLALLELEPQSEREKALYVSALARFDELSDYRAERLLISQMRLPGGMWPLLLVLGAIAVSSVYLFEMQSVWLHIWMTGAMTASLTYILILVFELDQPFSGYWRVSQVPFRRLLEPNSGSTASQQSIGSDHEDAPSASTSV